MEELFGQLDDGRAIIYLSFMSIFEVAYLSFAKKNVEAATTLVLQIRNLGLEEIWPDEDILWKAAEVKAIGGLSLADSFIAALAMTKNAALIHRDPEFNRLEKLILLVKIS